ncbi:MAG TPA: VOC family protein [Gammaproteobacteria bacterium]|nr:VOC family protein [Gammaproteobacteria bacterium]
MSIGVQGLDYVVLAVGDLDRSLAFYRDRLGLSLRHRAEKFAPLETGRTRFGLFTRDAMAETLRSAVQPPAGTQAAFELDAARDELTADGVPGVTPPGTRP